MILLFRDEDLSVLNRAGLTTLQAKIYLTLAICGRQDIKTIAKAANIDRANVYREVLNLQKMALVRKMIGTPNLFDAVPIQDGVSILLRRKADEYEQIANETKKMTQHFATDKSSILPKEEVQFVMIPKKTMFIKGAIKSIQNAQKSNDTITSLRRFSQAMPYSFKAHQIALEKGVKTRVIIEKPESEQFSKYIQRLMAYPNFQLRYTPTPPRALGVCFDGNNASILVDYLADVTDSACLWTNHISFITLFQNYFETLWNSAIEISPSKCKNDAKKCVTMNDT